MWFNLNINRLALEYLPTFLRQKAVIKQFVFAFCKPVGWIYDSWIMKRIDDIYKLDHTGQVCLLRKALNDRFDPTERRITLEDGNRFIRQYIYTSVEQKPRFLSTPMYIYSRDDYADTGVDFIVVAPLQIINENPFAIAALVDFYKQDVKRYKIVSE